MSFGDVLKEVLSVAGEIFIDAVRNANANSSNPRAIYLQQLRSMRTSLSGLKKELARLHKILNENTDLTKEDKGWIEMEIFKKERELQETEKEYSELYQRFSEFENNNEF